MAAGDGEPVAIGAEIEVVEGAVLIVDLAWGAASIAAPEKYAAPGSTDGEPSAIVADGDATDEAI